MNRTAAHLQRRVRHLRASGWMGRRPRSAGHEPIQESVLEHDGIVQDVGRPLFADRRLLACGFWRDRSREHLREFEVLHHEAA